jgi:peptide/nickel transport system permease protein
MIEAPSTLPTSDARLPRGQALRRGLGANPLLLVGGLLSALIVVIALLAPVLAPFPGDAGTATHPFLVLRPPSAQHWFGTDNVGRDVYSRVLYGARISPLIAVIVLATGLLPDLLVGGHLPGDRDPGDRVRLYPAR